MPGHNSGDWVSFAITLKGTGSAALAGPACCAVPWIRQSPPVVMLAPGWMMLCAWARMTTMPRRPRAASTTAGRSWRSREGTASSAASITG